MSKVIFQVDYSSCQDTSRELVSNVTFLNEISSISDMVSSKLSESCVTGEFFNWDEFNTDKNQLKAHINKEVSRYETFKKNFDNFYLSLEDNDKKLSNLIRNQLKFIDENKDYGTYITLLQDNQELDFQNLLYDSLKKAGLPEHITLNTVILFSPDAKELIDELKGLSEEDLQIKIKRMYDNPRKTFEEVLFLEFLQLNKGTTYAGVVKDISEIISTGSPAAYLSSIYVGKDINQYKLDLRSVQGMLDKHVAQLNSNSLSNRRVQIKTEIVNRLKNIKDAKSAKLMKLDKIKSNVSKGISWLNIAIIAYQGVEVCVTQYKDVVEYGTEVDDAIAGGLIDLGGIALSIYGGAKIGAAVGAIAGPAGSATCAVVGAVGGFVFSGIISLANLFVIDPLLTKGYENIVEPAIKEINNELNDVSDWWDSIWW
ncbi:MAG: hypothetical protein ACRC7N_07365 [Clostridium sp.]